MANRNAIHILKNTLFPSQALPSSAYLGEPLVNLGDGIMFFSGGTSGSPTWVPSNNNPAYFEVGSNLYDLKIRNQITHYNGLNNLSGLFLSGTTNGFVLANISSIQGISTDTYFTGFTYNDANNLTISRNQGLPDLNVYINTFTGITVNGSVSATTYYGDGSNLTGLVTTDTYVTGFTYNNANIVTLSQNNGQADKTIDIGTLGNVTVNGNLTVTGTTNLNGPSYYNQTATSSNEIVNYGSLTSYTQNNDVYVTGFTYDNANTITLSRNQGKVDLSVNISTLSTITVNGNATVTGTTTTGNLIVNNPSGTTAIIGQGGLVIGSGGSPSNPGIGDLLVHGNFYVYGSGTTIATNELYIEDPTITLNYNPSGSSTSTSVGSGIIIQDGSGIIGTNSELLIGQLYLNGNINSNSEYTSAFGNANRGFYTQLNDIIIRNTNNLSSAPNGKRLIAEDDILDGGSY